MKYGRWLSNIDDPRSSDAYILHAYGNRAYENPAMMRQEWQHHLEWVRQNVIGPPKATPYYTSGELKAQGRVGIYAPLYED